MGFEAGAQNVLRSLRFYPGIRPDAPPIHALHSRDLGPALPGAPPLLSQPALDELEALGLVVGQAGLEQHRVHAELRVEQRHVAVHLDEEVDALVALVEVGVVV